MRSFIALAVALAALSGSVAADALVPSSAEYSFERVADHGYTVCQIVLTILSYPRPEVANVRFQIGGSPDKIVGGISVDVADTIFKDGLPSALQKVSLESASFSSAQYSSDGRMTSSQYQDGGIQLGTGDSNETMALMSALVQGEFAIQFRRAGAIVDRSYYVQDGPPQDVFSKFNACVKTLGAPAE